MKVEINRISEGPRKPIIEIYTDRIFLDTNEFDDMKVHLFIDGHPETYSLDDILYLRVTD